MVASFRSLGYSSERLESAAQARRLYLASVHHLLKHVLRPESWSSLRAVAPHFDRLRTLIATSSCMGSWHSTGARAGAR